MLHCHSTLVKMDFKVKAYLDTTKSSNLQCRDTN